MLREIRDVIITIAVVVIVVLVALKYFKNQLTSLYPQGVSSLGKDIKTIVSSPADTVKAIAQTITGVTGDSGYITDLQMRQKAAEYLAQKKALADQAS